MTDYRLSEEADRDLFEIAVYTVENWSERQAETYIDGLHGLFIRLAGNPRLGIASDDVRAGYFRRRYKSHVAFYTLRPRGILIMRVLHVSMDYLQHL
jgi:toxin ParE1/3/4